MIWTTLLPSIPYPSIFSRSSFIAQPTPVQIHHMVQPRTHVRACFLDPVWYLSSGPRKFGASILSCWAQWDMMPRLSTPGRVPVRRACAKDSTPHGVFSPHRGEQPTSVMNGVRIRFFSRRAACSECVAGKLGNTITITIKFMDIDHAYISPRCTQDWPPRVTLIEDGHERLARP